MRRLIAAVGLLPILAFATSSHEGPRDARRAHFTPHERPWNARRAYVAPQELQSSYDFIIAGGGLAGLVLASRLSEDSNTTVLVIEAGPTGDDVRSRIDTPVIAYFNGLMRSDYDWKRITTPQSNLGGRNISWPGGRVLGGSSAMNGMYMVRPSALELDAMATVLGDMDGADAWGWDSMYSAMKKSETFTPPSTEIQSEGNILYNAASHGTSGPIHTTYAGFVLPLFGQWGATLGNLGVHVSSDANGGEGWGAFVATSAINPSNWTRSYSKSAYIDPLPPRANLHIMTNQTVTRLIFDKSSGTLKATGVEYASNGYQQKPWPTVGVNKEVIIAGGPVGSPNILMQSGVGPSDKLTAAGVQVAHALPGVGQHVQDHLSTQVIFRTTAQTTAQLYANGAINGTNNPVASFVNSAIAYTNITDLLGDSASTFKQEVAANMTASANDRALNPSSDPTVTKGYQAVYQATVDQILTPAGQVELLLAMTGTGAGQDTFAVQAGIQHPFSTGEVYIATPNPFDYPVINPNYFSHRADVVLLREGIKLARKVGQTQPISNFVTAEVSPGPDVQTDEQVEAWLRTVVSTEFHPSCTCAMLPLDHGGVVDANLKVYGLANVRVADSSVFPLSFAAHLMAPTYGLAEQAAMIIKSEYNGTPSPAALAQTGTATGNSQPTGASSNDDKDSAGFKLGASPSLSMVFATVLTFLLPAIIL